MSGTGCHLCPRGCGVDRSRSSGACGAGAAVRIARAALHHWEEPCISGENGSGAVFFSGCALRCCYCQNYNISAGNFGQEISTERLAEIFLELQEKGAHNINLVNPTQYLPWILEAISHVRTQLHIPIVYNSSGYETVETIQKLDGVVDIYLPDLKYASAHRAQLYSGAADYFPAAARAIKEMHRQCPKLEYGHQGILLRGVIVRHLVLPKGIQDTMQVLKWIAEHFSPEDILLSLMSQYTPFYRSADYPEINRRVSTYEYNKALSYAQELGLQGFMQEKSAAKEEYTPPFDLEGV